MAKIENMFFEFRYASFSGEAFAISAESTVECEKNCYAEKYLNKVLNTLSANGKKVNITLKNEISESVKAAAGDKYGESEEVYAVEISENEIILSASSDRGLNYAVSTLWQLISANGVREGVIFDYPDKEVRGYRVYTPGEKSMKAFKEMIDMLVYYKYNSVIIEVGGAMEYKKHPAINRKWVEFCTEVNKSPDEADRIQHQYSWAKNSIHAENGDGAYITQEQMRDVVAYCKERGMEVIPEVPSLSHSDYIVMAYPELNERVEDAYPDTYCPSNPKSYEILFEIIDEVIDVFEPNFINIGHDEFYTAAICDKCKDKEPYMLYAEDITKIYNYLKDKNIKTIMWGEKVYGEVYIYGENGKVWPCGGTGNPESGIPRLVDCKYHIPKEVILLQWYWSLCTGEMEQEICDMGFKMIYGNFSAARLKDYRERIKLVSGGFVSNWGAFDEEYMQRNGQNYSLLTTAFILWNSEYNNEMMASLVEKVKEELYERYKKSLGNDLIEIVHTTDHFVKYKPFYCGYYIVPEEWTIGWHKITYTDKTKAELPVIYGYNIRETKAVQSDAGYAAAEATESSDVEVMGATYSVVIDDKLFYKTAYKNPHPEKEIEKIEYVSKNGIEVEAKYNI